MMFPGWTRDDFAAFAIEGFEARMEALRARIQPKLDALGHDLTMLLEEETGTPWFHHVARHMRRSVNPPTDTWVALNRLKKGYKATVHFGVGLGARGANACLVVKPECSERQTFADALATNATRWHALFRVNEDLLIGDVPNAAPEALLRAADSKVPDWLESAENLRRRKNFEFEMGHRMPPEQAAGMDSAGFVRETLHRLRSMLPLYLEGITATI